MKTEIKSGLKFKTDYGTINTVVQVTETRVIYTDGKTTSRGLLNRRQSTWWMSIKGFHKGVNEGKYILI